MLHDFRWWLLGAWSCLGAVCCLASTHHFHQLTCRIREPIGKRLQARNDNEGGMLLCGKDFKFLRRIVELSICIPRVDRKAIRQGEFRRPYASLSVDVKLFVTSVHSPQAAKVGVTGHVQVLSRPSSRRQHSSYQRLLTSSQSLNFALYRLILRPQGCVLGLYYPDFFLAFGRLSLSCLKIIVACCCGARNSCNRIALSQASSLWWIKCRIVRPV